MIKFNQNVWLNPYIDIKTSLRKKVKTYFQKDFFKLINNAVFSSFSKNYGKCEKT